VKVRDVISVRAYTIRCTTYGPPREQLQFILRAVDWLGPSPEEASAEETKPLWSDELAATLGQLRKTRALEDRRRLGPQDVTGQADSASIMGRTRETSPGPSQPNTQLPFGTQFPQPARARPARDGPEFLGARSLEPVLAGNTQREEIVSRTVKPSKANPAQLLSLLNRGAGPAINKPPANPSHVSPRRAVSKPDRILDSPTADLQTQLPTHINRCPTQTQATNKSVSSSSNRHVQPPKQVNNPEAASPRPRANTQQQTETAKAQDSQGAYIQKLASECSWMEDFEFTRESFNVPFLQLSLLRSEDSWHKPMVGHKFPDSNVPAKILMTLHQLIDEEAAMEAEPASDEYMEEDPSPEFPMESVDPSPDSVIRPTQDDNDATSQVSWSQSPSPEPPKMPTGANQQLPPDSSFEHVDTGVNRDNEDVDALPQSQQVISITSSVENCAPPSSPPIERRDKVAFDDDTEMEEYVPQGLGEDTTEGASGLQIHRIASASPPPQPVVQVKETPYIKGKNGERTNLTTSPALEKHNPSGTSKYHPSTSIVYGTYNDKASSGPQGKAIRSKTGNPATTDEEERTLQLEHRTHKPRLESDRHASGGNMPYMAESQATGPEAVAASPQQELVRRGRQLINSPILERQEPQQSPRSTFASAQVQASVSEMSATSSPPHIAEQAKSKETTSQATSLGGPLTSGSVKRKLDESLSKKNSRQSKRREIKIIGFDEDSPDSVDPAVALQAYREESLRKFREARQSKRSPESWSEPAEKGESSKDVESTQIESPIALEQATPEMSPRHESLYAAPSAEEPTPKAVSVPHSSLIESPGKKSQLNVETHLSTPARRSTEHQPPATTSNVETTSSVFGLFKVTYPEYTGDIKHFQGQCTQMLQLDLEDKMVPKWQWDDYIIRNRADYKDYALECVDRGENPEPYHRFYKDTICDTIYRKGVIAGRPTLLKALEQLNVHIPALGSGHSAVATTKNTKRPRTSLPSTFNDQRVPTKNHISVTPHKRPRHSLPAQSQQNNNMSVKNPPPTKAPTSTSHNGNTTSESGDPFRDFYFAYQRTTSLTGSTKVSSKQK
jgi:hypothetical protein